MNKKLTSNSMNLQKFDRGDIFIKKDKYDMTLTIYAVPIIWISLLFITLIATTNVLANDIVIRDVTIIDVKNEEDNILNKQQIVIKDGRIFSVSPQVSPPASGTTMIDGSKLIALPGFINTHTHLWQHVAKGFYPSGNLQQWVRIYRYSHYFTDHNLYRTIYAAASQALLSGITTVSDFASANFSDFSLDATCRALNDTGMGGIVVWWNPASFLPYSIKSSEIKRLQSKCGKLDIWMGQGPLSFFPIPAVYDGISLAKENNLTITEHTMENVQEQRDFYKSLSKYLSNYSSQLSISDKNKLQEILNAGAPTKVDGVAWIERLAKQIVDHDNTTAPKLTPVERERLSKWIDRNSISPVPLLDYFGAITNTYVSIHSVWQSETDIELYQKKGVHVSHNPESNQYLSSGIAPILTYKQKGINVSLGTDGAASNDGINFFSAMRALWNLQKTGALNTAISKDIDPIYVIRAATINGAKALGREKQTGSIEQGKEADIVLLSKERLGISPYVGEKTKNNIIALIIYSGNLMSIESVISDGRVVVEKGQLTKGDTVAKLAHDLTSVSNELVKEVEAGKNWTETFNLTDTMIDPYWYKYRSVRQRDRIDLTIKNRGSKNITVTLAMSGAVFGGAASEMLSDKTRRRFPLDPTKNLFFKKNVLAPDQSITIVKKRRSTIYNIKYPNQPPISRDGKDQVTHRFAEQILILGER